MKLNLKDVASDLVHSTTIDSDNMTGSHWDSGIKLDFPPFDKRVWILVLNGYKTRR